MSASANSNLNKGPRILAVIWALSTITFLVVGARLYIRVYLIRNAGIDDYIILGSLCLTLACVGMTTANIHMGYGRHAWYLEESTVQTITMVNTISFAVGIFCFTLPKVAVTTLLTRILNPSRTQRIVLWTLIGITSTATWEHNLVNEGRATCNIWLLIRYGIANAVISACVDLYLAIYPSTVLMKLHMPLRKRLALCAALGMGLAAAAMAIVKSSQFPDLAHLDDYTYETADLVMWTNVEANVLILASCIPTLQPILELTLRGHVRAKSPQRKDANYLRDYTFHGTGHRTNRRSDRSITQVESQESILGDERHKNSHPLGAIVRTDDVSVEYNTRSMHSMPDRHATWRIA
ncbi:uncharacterized protein BDW43DRAFT_298711 [Aspergillus alliaceus]|uniref:uncharacterized protein n=1 Tax=Petromyces alliaceus TaxID=209559 RepID=UPI0012A5608B|nr:uncharacterized protein BDW43DRAFT_298711 [Aspergillus alliaceus]KAB8235660.1 hypothetical protein BDW43DRAFT_298711 [Aspergillus alliaceus]